MSYLEKWFAYTDRQLAMKHSIEQALTQEEGAELELNEFLLLYFLSRADDHRLRQNSLQDKLHLSASAISRMLSRMEVKDCGVIEKTTCPNDKRGTYIALTPAGSDLLGRVLTRVEDSLAQYRDYLD